jgi:hypothetical protein
MAELRKPGMDDGGTGRALGSSGMHAALREGMAEGFWPKAGAVLAAGVAVACSVASGRTEPFDLVLAAVLFGGIGYFALGTFGRSRISLRALRQVPRSPAFLLGGAAGLAYFVYVTFVGPTAGPEWGGSSVFHDGAMQGGLAAAVLLLKAAGHVVAGGLLVEVFSRRLSGARQAESGEKNAR